jgi:hypothetical protein
MTGALANFANRATLVEDNRPKELLCQQEM